MKTLIERLHNWGDQWLLEFEATKSQSLLVSNKREETKAQHRPLSMGGFTVEEKEQAKAVGFIIDPKGNRSLHVQQKTAADARKWLGATRKGGPLAGQPEHHDGLQSLCEILN